MTPLRLAALACVLVSASCSGSTGSVPPRFAPPSRPAAAQAKRNALQTTRALGKIQHVVVIVQENRSFDDLFNGYPGANTVTQGRTSTGRTILLKSVPLGTENSVDHLLSDYLKAYDGGKMDGFDLELGGGPPDYYAYEKTRRADVRTYWEIAAQYVLGDAHFPSNLDASFVAHQYLIAAQANDAVDVPTGAWGCSGGYDEIPTITPQRTHGPDESPCFDYTTLADELDAAGLTWRYYAPAADTQGGIWSAFQAIEHIYQSGSGPQWLANVISPETQVLDLGPDGKLDSVTWVVPSYPNSDHPGNNSNTGPAWVASVINAVGESPYWDSTAIFVLWDDWGGLYDHVPPPQPDFDGLGIRTPLLCISPYARRGVVSHVRYESAGIVRFIEDTFGLQPMATADARATSAGKGCVDLSQRPRRFHPFATTRSKEYFAHQKPDYRAPDTDF